MSSGSSAQLTAEEVADVGQALSQVPSLRRRVEQLQAGAQQSELEEKVQRLEEENRTLRQAEADAAQRIRELENQLEETESLRARQESQAPEAKADKAEKKGSGLPDTTPPDSAEDQKVYAALISGRGCSCLFSPKRTLREVKQEAEQELGVAIRSLIGPNMEPVNEDRTLEEENVLPGTTLTVVAVDQQAEDEKEAAKCDDIFDAVRDGNVAAVRHFLRTEPGAATATDDFGGFTALHWAAENGHAEVCRLLLAAGAQTEAKNDWGHTPLHRAARYGHTEAAKALLEANASVAATDNDGDTPLHWAASQGHAEVVQALLEAKASVAATDDDGKTPVDKARENRKDEVVQILEQARDAKGLGRFQDLSIFPLTFGLQCLAAD